MTGACTCRIAVLIFLDSHSKFFVSRFKILISHCYFSNSPGPAFCEPAAHRDVDEVRNMYRGHKTGMQFTKEVKATKQGRNPSEDLAFPGCHRDPRSASLCPSHSPSLSPRLLNQSCISTVACQAFCCRHFDPITKLTVAAFVHEQIAMHAILKSRVLYQVCNAQKHKFNFSNSMHQTLLQEEQDRLIHRQHSFLHIEQSKSSRNVDSPFWS